MRHWNSIEEALAFAIAEEQAAADFYHRLAKQAELPGMKGVFAEFAQEEMNHKARLEAVRAGGGFLVPAQKVVDLKIADYLMDVTPDPRLNYREVLVLAMKKEKAAFMLYSELAERATDENLKSVFRALAEEEARHKLRFEIEYDDLMADN